MPVKSDDPLRRVTLNLYEADCVWLERTYGYGWTERIRQHIHDEVHSRQNFDNVIKDADPKRTLGDLFNE